MISSRYNPQFKDLKACLEPRGAKKQRKVLVSGRKIVPELLSHAIAAVIEEDHWPDELPSPKSVIRMQRSLFKDLDIFGTHYPLLVYELPEMTAWREAPPAGIELVLSLQDPANLGACLRSAEAFGVQKIILLKECAFAFHPKAIRASSGSCFRLPLHEGPALKEFASDGLMALDMNGTSLDHFEWPADGRLLVGEEGQGLPAALDAKRISIRMRSSLDSMNATVAASIALFSYRLKHPDVSLN